MADVKITVRPNGSHKVEGPVEVYDGEGNRFPLDESKPAIALCRCGASKKAPFCDGSHKAAGFESEVTAPAESSKRSRAATPYQRALDALSTSSRTVVVRP